ncbi:MAG: SUMF1/EgtB/PvdO family nonheme iron enzyme [Bacteroidales bacterium]|jgi:formylglycine-generating enzyme required for sulfatase activity/dienelactone hydrolase|nr:SUMF1/EgtB/PvdO family nonheme iron enzyme [Bacteroidales bacterium]
MSSIIEGYSYDIFISYRQKDNKYDGWVTEFVDHLRDELEATFKDEITVYFDLNPYDGLLETHDVDESLKEKLKCLVLIPIISRTYCDPKAFSWEHEFRAFINAATNDRFGLRVKLPNGNVASRVLPVRIHDLDLSDIKLCESILGTVLRGVEFIYKEPGVNRSLLPKDNDEKNLNRTNYRNQINKVALAVKDIIEGMHFTGSSDLSGQEETKTKKYSEKEIAYITSIKEPLPVDKSEEVTEVIVEKEGEFIEPKFSGRFKLLIAIGVALVVTAISIFLIINHRQKNYARNIIIPEIRILTEENFIPPARAFELATEAQKSIPNDSVLATLWPKVSRNISLQTQPPGAKVYWKDYNKPDDPWKENGVTPFKKIRFPLGSLRLKIEKDGFQTLFFTDFSFIDLNNPLALDSINKIPENMVRIPARVSSMRIIGLEKYEGAYVGEFLADKFEVTNKQYKSFVNAGGYTDGSYWKYPFYSEGKELTREKAMSLFVDKTGRQGPASWEAETYPEGKENHPVTGISWYEAAAYAEFIGKSLPTVYHWNIMTETNRGMEIIPLSNFGGVSTVPAGSMEGMSSYGIYDLAGNAREWCFNGNGTNGESYILGGGWNDPTYSFNEAGSQPSLSRTAANGFRCIMTLPGDTSLNHLSENLVAQFRDYTKEKPVDDDIYNIFLRQYEYDKSPLNAKVIAETDTGSYITEEIVLDAGYSDEKLIVYLFIPRDVQPPYQPVVFFPGSNAIMIEEIPANYVKRVDFLVKSGRVLVYPILKGIHERKDELKSSNPEETVFYKEHVIMWRKDIGRTIDYLETRDDILSDKIAYFGYSWGGRMGGLFPAVEKRLKVLVLHVGGMGMYKAFPEVDPMNFITRINQPVLMLNGKHDMYFPVETSQLPMFNYFGTPPEDKKIIIYDTGHLVPRNELIKETLAWLDKYLGPVK